MPKVDPIPQPPVNFFSSKRVRRTILFLVVSVLVFISLGLTDIKPVYQTVPQNSSSKVRVGPQQLPWSYDINEKCEPQDSDVSAEDIAKHRNNWQSFMKNVSIPVRPANKTITRGIVFTAFSGVIKEALISIAMLRNHGCVLPIEVWHYGPELSEDDIKRLTALRNVKTKDMTLVQNRMFAKVKKDRMWEMKGATLLYSSFDQVLLLDTDNLPARDPTFLFTSAPFVETGSIFWKDFSQARPNNPIWRILGISCTKEFEQESGQVLIDKSRPDTLKALHLAAYMQMHGDVFFKFFWGDKETFRLAWRTYGAPYHMVRPHLAAIGTSESSGFCGHSMVQFTPM